MEGECFRFKQEFVSDDETVHQEGAGYVHSQLDQLFSSHGESSDVPQSQVETAAGEPSCVDDFNFAEEFGISWSNEDIPQLFLDELLLDGKENEIPVTGEASMVLEKSVAAVQRPQDTESVGLHTSVIDTFPDAGRVRLTRCRSDTEIDRVTRLCVRKPARRRASCASYCNGEPIWYAMDSDASTYAIENRTQNKTHLESMNLEDVPGSVRDDSQQSPRTSPVPNRVPLTFALTGAGQSTSSGYGTPSTSGCSQRVSHLESASEDELCAGKERTSSDLVKNITDNIKHLTDDSNVINLDDYEIETVILKSKKNSYFKVLVCGCGFTKEFVGKKPPHTCTPTYQCKYCHKKLRSRRQLNSHQRNCQKVYVCAICQKQYVYRKYLDNHMLARHKMTIGDSD